MTKRMISVLTRPAHRQNALSAPRSDVFSPPPADRLLPVHSTRIAPLTEHASWAFVAVHGGSGAGLLTQLARHPYDLALAAAVAAGQPPLGLPAFAVNAGRAWPDPVRERTTQVVVVCRTTMRGLGWRAMRPRSTSPAGRRTACSWSAS